jgi:signal transduction histidine kinase
VSETPAIEYQPPLTWRGQAWRYAVAFLISTMVWSDAISYEWDHLRWFVAVDLLAGAVGFALVPLRRHHPLAVGLATASLTAVSSSAAGPAALALTSLATRRERSPMAAAGVTFIAANLVFSVIVEQPEGVFLSGLVGPTLVVAALLGWGQFIGSRRELMWNLRQRVERAEAEQELRAAEARATERTRIAREMHDVVAHRISQVSMRAGAMAFRDDLTAEQLRAESALVRDSANEALRELRSVLNVLRDTETGEIVEQPQPTYRDIRSLIADAVAGGMRVDVVDEVVGEPPTEVGRTMYRIVQEGITNAAKHAPGSLLSISLTGDAVGDVTVTLTNPLGFGPTAAPGAELGLVGIAERVEVAGGRFERRSTATDFTIEATLPCPT